MRNAYRRREEDLKEREEKRKERIDANLVDLKKIREMTTRWQKKAAPANKRCDEVKTQLDKAKRGNEDLKAELRAKNARLEQLERLICDIYHVHRPPLQR